MKNLYRNVNSFFEKSTNILTGRKEFWKNQEELRFKSNGIYYYGGIQRQYVDGCKWIKEEDKYGKYNRTIK